MRFEGQCYACGEYGHSARFCPHDLGNGKSKGKGKDQTIVTIVAMVVISQPIARRVRARVGQ